MADAAILHPEPEVDTPRRAFLVLPMEAKVSEVEALLSVERKAFKTNPFFDFCFHRPGVEQLPLEVEVRSHLDRMAQPSFRYYKAVDASDGSMVGTGSWYFAEDPFKETVNSPWGDPPNGAHIECIEAFVGPLRRWRWEHFRKLGAPYAYMLMLSVAPEVQRQGIGSALILKGLEEVDRLGWHTYISASPAGLGLYKKHGWIPQVQNTIKLKQFGGPDFEEIVVGLVRSPSRPDRASNEPVDSGTQQ